MLIKGLCRQFDGKGVSMQGLFNISTLTGAGEFSRLFVRFGFVWDLSLFLTPIIALSIRSSLKKTNFVKFLQFA